MYRISVIDDDPSWCVVMATRLQQQGYFVETFTDANVFLKKAEEFDLALIDFSMPPKRYQANTDGPDLIRALRQQIRNPPLLVLISAYFLDDLLQLGSELCPEADAYLSKNTDSLKMLQQIEQLLESKKTRIRSRAVQNESVVRSKVPSHVQGE